MGKTIVKPQNQTFVCGKEDKKGEGVGRINKRLVREGCSGISDPGHTWLMSSAPACVKGKPSTFLKHYHKTHPNDSEQIFQSVIKAAFCLFSVEFCGALQTIVFVKM